MKLKITNKNITHRALIVAALSDEDIKLVKKEELKFIGIIELRIDTFKDFSPAYVERIFRATKQSLKKPLLGTIRIINEGGKSLLPEDTRIELFKTIIPIADIIDIELNSEIYKKIVQMAHSAKKTVIASYHNLKETPNDATLSRLLLKAKSASPDIIKFATKAKTTDDVGRLLCFTLKHKEEHLVTISLGEKGKISRLINPLFGSLLTYAYIGGPKADGQIHVKQMGELLTSFYKIMVNN